MKFTQSSFLHSDSTLNFPLGRDAQNLKSVVLEREEVEVAQVEKHFRHVGYRPSTLNHFSPGPVNIWFDIEFDLPGLVRNNPWPSLNPDRLRSDRHFLPHLDGSKCDILLLLVVQKARIGLGRVVVLMKTHFGCEDGVFK